MLFKDHFKLCQLCLFLFYILLYISTYRSSTMDTNLYNKVDYPYIDILSKFSSLQFGFQVLFQEF